MRISIKKRDINGSVNLVSSKSESNRALIIRALSGENFEIENLSESNDTRILMHALEKASGKTNDCIIDIEDCGTAMRFLTGYLAVKEGEFILTGSERMKQRPVKLLVDALNQIGAEIYFLENEGYPPLRIIGKKEIKQDRIQISANISSQYISALLMIAPTLKNGLNIFLKGKVVSEPYIRMTLQLMEKFGIKYLAKENHIRIEPQKYIANSYKINADWSAASYYYEITALADRAEIELKGIRKTGVQGDEIVAEIYKKFGVETICNYDSLVIRKERQADNNLLLDLGNYPDLAQSIAVTACGLKLNCRLTNLETLRIKETDRILALSNELSKFGYNVVSEKDNQIVIMAPEHELQTYANIETYQDHRMALSFAPLALKHNYIEINQPEVVKKSYPGYWEHLKDIGFEIET